MEKQCESEMGGIGMNRHGIVDVIGPEYLTANIEEDVLSMVA